MIKNQRVFWSGQYLFPDTDDPGDEPDVGLLEGTVTFAPVWDAGVSGLLSDSQRSTYVKPFPIEIRDGQLMSDDDGTWIPGVKIPASIGGHPIAWVARFDLSAGGEKITVRELRFTSNPDGEVHLHNVIPAEAIFPQLPPDIVKGDSVTNIYTQGQYVVFIVGDPPRTKQYVLAFPGTDEAIAAAEAAVVEFEQLRDAGVLAIEQTRTSAETAIGQARDEVQGLKDDASTQAGIATTKAGEAGGFRNEAEGFKSTASTQAGIATTKAGEAQGFRNEAEGFKDEASTQAGIATTKAGEAQGFRNETEGFKNDASTQAGIATTRAGEAQGFRNEAEGFKNQALAARLSWKGVWNSSTAYVERDVVSHGGSSWWAKQPSTGVEPVEGATWSLVASKGEQGEGITSAADLTGALTDQVDASRALVSVDLSSVGGRENEWADMSGWVATLYLAVAYASEGLVGKADADHTHTRAEITDLAPALALKADLDGSGKLSASQLPALAITEFLGTPASQAAMLALSGQRGDWCVRTDRGTQWILIADNPAVIGSWREMVTPAAPVSSVAGRTGAVTLSKSDVGLSAVDNTSDLNKPISSAVSAALGTKAASDHTHPEFARVAAAPATWHWAGTSLPTAASQVHAQARVGDFIVAPNLTTDPGWHRITGV